MAKIKTTDEIRLALSEPLDEEGILTDFWYQALSYFDDKSRTALRTTNSDKLQQVERYRWYNIVKLERIEQWRFLSWHCANYAEILKYSAKEQQFTIDRLLAYVQQVPASTLHRALALTTLALLRAPDKNGELNRQLNFTLACASWIDPKMADTLKSILYHEKRVKDGGRSALNDMLEWLIFPERNGELCQVGAYEPHYLEIPLWTSLLTLRPGTTERLVYNMFEFTPAKYDFYDASLSDAFDHDPSKPSSDQRMFVLPKVPLWRMQIILRNITQISPSLCEQLILYYLKIDPAKQRSEEWFWQTFHALLLRIPQTDVADLITRNATELSKRQPSLLTAMLLLKQRAGLPIDWEQLPQAIIKFPNITTTRQFYRYFATIVPLISEQIITSLFNFSLRKFDIQNETHITVRWGFLSVIAPRLTKEQAKELFAFLEIALTRKNAQYALFCFAGLIPHLEQEMLPAVFSVYDICYNLAKSEQWSKKLLSQMASLVTLESFPEYIKRLEAARTDPDLPANVAETYTEEECAAWLRAFRTDEIREQFYDQYISVHFPLVVPIAPDQASPERSHRIHNEVLYCTFLAYPQSKKFVEEGTAALHLPLPPNGPATKGELRNHILTLMKILASSPRWCLIVEPHVISDILESFFQLTIINPHFDANMNIHGYEDTISLETSCPELIQVLRNLTPDQAGQVCNIIQNLLINNPQDAFARAVFVRNKPMLLLCLMTLRKCHDHIIDLDTLFNLMKELFNVNTDWGMFERKILKQACVMLIPLLSVEQCQDYFSSCIHRWSLLRGALDANGKPYRPSRVANLERQEYLTPHQVEFMGCIAQRFHLHTFDEINIFTDNYFAEPLAIDKLDQLIEWLKDSANENEDITLRCANAVKEITAYCDSLTQLSELQALRRRLFDAGYQDPQLEYLFARRGFFTLSTLNRHQLFSRTGEAIDCSDTAVSILTIIQDRMNALTEANPALTNELTQSDDEFLDQTGSGWANYGYE